MTNSAAQLSLSLTSRLEYSAENFVVHSGVRAILKELEHGLVQQAFHTYFIFGPPRSGKSHLGVYLVDYCARIGLYARYLDGSYFLSNLEAGRLEAIDEAQVLVVDDLHLPGDYLESGRFVSFIEKARINQKKVILLSGQSVPELHYDDHVMSRIRSATPRAIAAPDDDEIEKLLHQLARQRGIALPDRELRFLKRRIGRDIASLESYLRSLERLASIRSARIKAAVIHDAVGS